ncbi:MAG: hypothetical protein IPJ40_21305 [Saprospirales bacterium]|nr:hypothetical protein [Saprospirales bacterium]
MNLQFGPFSERSSERLQLRQMNEADIQEIFFSIRIERIQEFIYRPQAEPWRISGISSKGDCRDLQQ